MYSDLSTEQLLDRIILEESTGTIESTVTTEIVDYTRKSAAEIADIFENEQSSENPIDYRLRQLSHSGRLLLHKCARKFQLEKLSTTGTEDSEDTKLTFAFGHTVGLGIAKVMQGWELDKIYWELFKTYSEDLLAEDTKRNKSFFYAILAVERLFKMKQIGFLSDYEVVELEGKPAEELSFSIAFPDGFNFRGTRLTLYYETQKREKLVILENKTGSGKWNTAKYKNSAQALGYSVVLDYIDENLSDYMVLYLYYDTKALEFTVEAFPKSMLNRAIWIRELLLDIDIIKLYSKEDIFPMHGENCFDFYRECKYYGLCTMATESLTKPLSIENIDKTVYQYYLTISDLLDTQLGKL